MSCLGAVIQPNTRASVDANLCSQLTSLDHKLGCHWLKGLRQRQITVDRRERSCEPRITVQNVNKSNIAKHLVTHIAWGLRGVP